MGPCTRLQHPKRNRRGLRLRLRLNWNRKNKIKIPLVASCLHLVTVTFEPIWLRLVTVTVTNLSPASRGHPSSRTLKPRLRYKLDQTGWWVKCIPHTHGAQARSLLHEAEGPIKRLTSMDGAMAHGLAQVGADRGIRLKLGWPSAMATPSAC